jgi:hypothetical protein
MPIYAINVILRSILNLVLTPAQFPLQMGSYFACKVWLKSNEIDGLVPFTAPLVMRSQTHAPYCIVSYDIRQRLLTWMWCRPSPIGRTAKRGAAGRSWSQDRPRTLGACATFGCIGPQQPEGYSLPCSREILALSSCYRDATKVYANRFRTLLQCQGMPQSSTRRSRCPNTEVWIARSGASGYKMNRRNLQNEYL